MHQWDTSNKTENNTIDNIWIFFFSCKSWRSLLWILATWKELLSCLMKERKRRKAKEKETDYNEHPIGEVWDGHPSYHSCLKSSLHAFFFSSLPNFYHFHVSFFEYRVTTDGTYIEGLIYNMVAPTNSTTSMCLWRYDIWLSSVPIISGTKVEN